MILSIDPGIRALGWALFVPCYHGVFLAHAGLSRTKEKHLDQVIKEHVENILHRVSESDRQVAVSVVETMQIDGRQVPPQDLLDVQAVGFAVAASLGPVRSLRPSQWKGTLPKTVHHARIRGALESHELEILNCCLGRGVPKAHWKEVLDAVGIGCYYLKRTTRAGVRRQ